MTENVENLILEHLKLLRNEVKAQGLGMDEQFESVRLRLSSIEGQMAGIHADIAIMHGRMDKVTLARSGLTVYTDENLTLRELAEAHGTGSAMPAG